MAQKKTKAKAKIDPQDQAVYEALGRAIQARRKKLDLSQEELAHLVGLNAAYLGGVERGERNVAVKNITKIAKGLGQSVAQLFRDAGL